MVHINTAAPVRVSRSCELDEWTSEQLQIMKLGGNGNARTFFRGHGIRDMHTKVGADRCRGACFRSSDQQTLCVFFVVCSFHQTEQKYGGTARLYKAHLKKLVSSDSTSADDEADQVIESANALSRARVMCEWCEHV